MKRESLGVTVIDDYTLKVSMEYSYPEFVLQTPNAVYMPCNEEFFLSTNGHYGLDDDYIISNGPFIIPVMAFSGYSCPSRNRDSLFLLFRFRLFCFSVETYLPWYGG